MRIMGLDVGEKTIGVAISDELGWTAQGLVTIRRESLASDLKKIEEIISQQKVEALVVGLPKNMNGTIGPQGEKVLQFVESLKEITDIPVHLVDERLTTVTAERILIAGDVRRKKRKQVIDKLAATVILQNFLDRQ
jgi:putative Holliday junction resolvase